MGGGTETQASVILKGEWQMEKEMQGSESQFQARQADQVLWGQTAAPEQFRDRLSHSGHKTYLPKGTRILFRLQEESYEEIRQKFQLFELGHKIETIY